MVMAGRLLEAEFERAKSSLGLGVRREAFAWVSILAA